MNMPTLPNKRTLNFNCGWVAGTLTDVGGYTYYYLKQHPQIKVLYGSSTVFKECRQKLSTLPAQDPLAHFLEAPLDNPEFYVNFTFLHYRAGSNWDKKSAQYHEMKTKIFNKFILEILQK
jgi:hypothetical protein